MTFIGWVRVMNETVEGDCLRMLRAFYLTKLFERFVERIACMKSSSLWSFLLNFLVDIFFIFETVDSRNLKESIERAEFSLYLELWFGEQSPGSILTLASSRTLQLNFHPGRGLHYHLPVLFDYFHLASISLSINASLVALHQPYIKYVDLCDLILWFKSR